MIQYLEANTSMLSGDLILCENTIRKGNDLLKGLYFPQVDAQLKAALAMVHMFYGRFSEAEDLIDKAREEFSSSKLFYLFAQVLYAGMYLAQGKTDQALDKTRSALELSQINGYEFWLPTLGKWIVPLLVRLYANGEMTDYIRKIFKMMDSGVQDELIRIEKTGDPSESRSASLILEAFPKTPPPGIRLNLLGRFRVSIGEDEIPARQWKSKKAKMLLKLLVHYRNKGFMSKEVFMEHLWPEKDPLLTAKRFHVALVALRKVLEPGVKRAGRSSYILSDRD